MDREVQIIHTLLRYEQHAGPVNGQDDLMARQARRITIKHHLDALSSEVQQLREQASNLPKLPPLAPIFWAQSVQAMPNLVFLELDTTGLSLDAEIIHALVLDASGAVLLSVYARPSEPMSANIAHITGITNDVLEEKGVAIAELIGLVRDTLKGKYVLSYNLHFDANKLSEAATRLGQENIPIIGDDLMQQAMHYFGTSSYPKLETLCNRIGHPLPEHPHQLALDRARGQLALLDALATVVTDQHASSTSIGSSEGTADHDGDDLADQDEQPF